MRAPTGSIIHSRKKLKTGPGCEKKATALPRRRHRGVSRRERRTQAALLTGRYQAPPAEPPRGQPTLARKNASMAAKTNQ